MFRPFNLLAPKDFSIVWLSSLLALSVHDERLLHKRVMRIKFAICVL
jgi:hypothetical protein